MRWSLLIASFLPLLACAQVDTATVPHSQNGWYLSPHGTIRVLLIFAEIEYDLDRTKDPQPNGAEHWPQGKLPLWKDDVFDPFALPVPKATVSRYYHDISLGQCTVLGDYVDELVVIRESEHRNIGNAHGLGALAVAELNKRGSLHTHYGLGIADLDLWKRGGRPGMPKTQGADDPHSYDHVMVILRNSGLTHGQGSVDPGSPGKLFGFESDSQSRFGAMNALPFEILKHEFNHLFLGGNNFHSGGGNASQFQSYFINLQGGWSMMGGASSSLLTCTAWDRQRLGWKAPGNVFTISARNTGAQEVNGDLDPLAGDTGTFILRDFVTSGDALRIKMPFLPNDRFSEWLWIENHQGYAHNGSPTDRFHWEEAGTCAPRLEPALFMTMQVDREDRAGPGIYGGYADHLRPVLANGNYDMRLRGDTIRGACPFGGNALPVVRDPDLGNPLTGNHEQELPVYDRNQDGRLQRGEHYVPGARSERGAITGKVIFFGNPEHGFRMGGNRRLGMGTNPSSANMMTLVSTGTGDSFKRGAPNVRTIYLNGISVELLAMEQGAARVRVRTNDTRIEEDVRWCADSIVLPPLKGPDGYALIVAAGARLTLDRSLTPTRIDAPEEVNGRLWFSDRTRLTVTSGASVLICCDGALALDNGAELHVMPGASIRFAKGAKLRMGTAERIVLHGDGQLIGPEKTFKKARSRGLIMSR
ncbi:MAG: hypothetical protein KDB84_03140 [Flavobacteriales bacterium]|nr:hypothetical protein [Flavobacteriales bacterium]